MANINKNDIISKIYYDKSGFGSKATTLRDSKKKDQSITMKDVEEFFRKNVEEKKATTRQEFIYRSTSLF